MEELEDSIWSAEWQKIECEVQLKCDKDVESQTSNPSWTGNKDGYRSTGKEVGRGRNANTYLSIHVDGFRVQSRGDHTMMGVQSHKT